MNDTLTRSFASLLHERMAAELPAEVHDQARRTWLNVTATSVGASRSSGVELLVDHATDIGARGAAPVLGRSERLDQLTAPVVNGFAAHVDDFDDTHLATVIHPGAANLAAVLASPHDLLDDGGRVLRAFALGCEAQLRVGVAMSPEHYDAGWHITGTCAPIGAAVAVGLLMDLDTVELAHAIGIAASQSLGQREGFGTMVKAFHPGKGAANGVHAALLAARGFTAPADALENPRGYFVVLSPDGHRAESIVAGGQERWELLDNTFKPYPCGIVCHPSIEAAVELHDWVVDVGAVQQVTARVHPLVPELTGNQQPADGLEARFSTVHGITVGLADGRAGLPEYTDERVRASDVSGLRSKVRLEVEESLRRDEAHLEVVLDNGETLRTYVGHARGSLDRPLTDEELADKARTLIEPVLPGASEAVIDAVDRMADGAPLSELLDAACPSGGQS